MSGRGADDIAHATLISVYAGADWRGVLLRGPSGAGKSSLALRAMAQGFRLVADDRVILWRSGGQVFGRAPDVLAGLIEVRGVGVLPAGLVLRLSAIALIADLAPETADLDRTPEPQTATLASLAVPCIQIRPFEASAPQVMLAALAAVQRPL